MTLDPSAVEQEKLALERRKLDIEERKIEFERSKVSYQEVNSHLRHLNDIMWKIPLIATSITGGLWIALSRFDSINPRFAGIILLFAGAVNLLLSFALVRVRDIIGAHIEKIREFFPSGYPQVPQGSHLWQRPRFVAHCFVGMLLMSMAVNVLIGIRLVASSELSLSSSATPLATQSSTKVQPAPSPQKK